MPSWYLFCFFYESEFTNNVSKHFPTDWIDIPDQVWIERIGAKICDENTDCLVMIFII